MSEKETCPTCGVATSALYAEGRCPNGCLASDDIPPDLLLAERGDIRIRKWHDSILIENVGGDDESILLSPDDFAWLVTYPGPLIAGRIAEGKRRPIARKR